jgi:SAM-dependent methyltransferase
VSADAHAAAVEREFTQQAAGFEDPRLNVAFTSEAGWALEGLGLSADDLLLDVAGGTGHLARTVAPRVRAAIVLDATWAMLDTGRRAAAREAAGNVCFLHGDAAALPFPDASFDVVACRFALHHMEDPAPAVAEMTRCVRPGGRLLLADMVADEDPATAAERDRAERLRDPSHTRILSLAELRALPVAGGLTECDVRTAASDRALGPWLESAGTPAEATTEIEAALARSSVGLEDRDGERWFTQRFAAVVAERA